MNCYHKLEYDSESQLAYCFKCNARFSFRRVTELANEAIHYNKCYWDLLHKQQPDQKELGNF
jgi:hypothetical protein